MKDLRPVAGFFYRISKFLPTKILILLYNSLINSKLSYCIDSWGNAPAVHLNKLFILQKKIVRFINKKPFDFPSKQLFVKNNILTVQNLYSHKILIHAHRTYHSSTMLPFLHRTRYCLNLNISIPFYKSSSGQKTSEYRESALWNKLPIELKSITNVNLFKARLKLHLLL